MLARPDPRGGPVSEGTLHTLLTWTELGLAAITVALLLVVSAPYGRHARAGWGPRVNSRLGWVVMESPAVLGFLAVYALGTQATSAPALALLSLWQGHYVYRTFVYPWRLKAGTKGMPVVVAALAFAFQCLNSYINARWVSELGAYPDAWLRDPRLLAGATLFLAGWAINYHADAVLLRLRGPGETGYRIPHGGLYRWVSCPNYLGEILEWTGWAIATWSLPGLAFAVYTAANLLPRALAHHRWYRERFPDYPSGRRALIPGLL
jgi:protein-S-isoprenylcysteine O-methyltransferase Ste14